MTFGNALGYLEWNYTIDSMCSAIDDQRTTGCSLAAFRPAVATGGVVKEPETQWEQRN
jgi:hypothetical protein